MKYRLDELIDIERFQDLQDRLNKVYSFPSSIIDNEGNILTASGWQKICTDFHRTNEITELACIDSDMHILDNIHKADPCLIYECPHGLVDCAAPIYIDGVHYGSFFVGQFFLKKPDMQYFRSQAERYGFDEDAYLKAVEMVPICTQEQLDGYLFFVRGLIEFISESGLKKLREIEKENTENRYRSILKAAMDGYWLVDKHGRLLEVNDAYCRMSGYSEVELLTMRISDLDAVESLDQTKDRMQRIISQGSDRFESRHRRKDEKLFDVEVSIQYRCENDGQYICFLRDISKRKKADDTLKYSENYLRILMGSLSCGVVVHAPDTSVEFANKSACRLLGISDNKIIGKKSIDPSWKFVGKDGGNLPLDEYPVSRILSSRKTIHNQILGVVNPVYDDVVWLLVNGFPVFSHGMNIQQIVISFVDITAVKHAQHAEIETAKRMKLAADSSKFGIWDLDLKNNRLEWDDWMFRLYGVDRKSFQGAYEAWQAGVHPDDLERSSKEVELAVSGEKDFDTEFRIVRPDGDIRHIRAYATVTRDSSGDPVKMTGVNFDITQRKQAEESLEEAKVFLDNMSESAYITDLHGVLLWANPVAESLTGLPLEKIIGKPFLSLFMEKDHPSIMAAYQRSLNGEVLENTVTFKTGVTCLVSCLPKRNAQGEIAGVFGVARDITARLQMEQALQEREEMYRITFDAIPDSITITSQLDGRYKYVNDGFCRITGFSKAEVIGNTPHDINLYADVIHRQTMINSLLQNGELLNHEIPFRRKDGTIWDSYFSARPIVIDGEDCLIALTKDVTDLKRAEEEKIRLESQLRQAQKMESVGRLAGGVAHDFNNMLSVILGNADMILEEIESDNPFYTNLYEIQNAAKRSAKITRQLLTFARKQAIEPRIIDVNESLANLLNMLKSLIGEDIELIWLPESATGKIRIDPSQLDQILTNLCVNSRDAISGTGKIIIETSHKTIDDTYCENHAGSIPGSYVLLTVSDNGKGMQEEVLSNLFEPFYTTKQIGQGTGLGLATVYGIVKQNNGYINVYSEPDMGSSFQIFLPRHESGEEQISSKSLFHKALRGEETILLVEDEPSILRMTNNILSYLGYNVICASKPVEAIRLAEDYNKKIDLLLTDVVMPEMNGRDLAEKLMSIYPEIGCLFMSGYTANVISQHGVLDQGVNFIQKPFSKFELSRKLREVLD